MLERKNKNGGKNLMKGNRLRSVINNMLLAIMFVNAGVGTAMLFGIKKGFSSAYDDFNNALFKH